MISFLQVDLAFIDGPEHFALQHEFGWSECEALGRATLLWAWVVRTEPGGIIESPHAGRMVLSAMRVVTRNAADVTRNVALLARTGLVELLPGNAGLRIRGASRYLAIVESEQRRKSQVRERVRKYRAKRKLEGNALRNPLPGRDVTQSNASRQDKTRLEKKKIDLLLPAGAERPPRLLARRGGGREKSSPANGHAPAATTADSLEADDKPHGADALDAWAALVHRASQLNVALPTRPPRAFAAWWADAKSLELSRLVGAFACFVLDVRAGSLGKRAGPSFELFARPAVWRQRLPPPEPEPEPVPACARCELIVPAERGFSPFISRSGDPICWDCYREMQSPPPTESAH